jgi:hypothetical protein
MSFSLFISYFITKYLSFDYLISYERDDFINRLIIVACFFLLPFIITAIYNIIDKIYKQNGFIKYSLFIFSGLLITTSLYITYPRFDNFYNSHGYSVGQNDIEAVHWINNNTKKDYIVLANQQVSAAALGEFGFNKYYKKNIFYYPIPTSAPLYQYYLDMVYKKPTKKTVQAAMDLAGVDKGYFVLNKYWWAYKKIADEAKLEADSWYEIDNGELIIFKYSK